MNEYTAYAIDIVVGTLLTCGSVMLVSALGANGGLQAFVGVWGLIITSFMVGIIGTHFSQKRAGPGAKDDS